MQSVELFFEFVKVDLVFKDQSASAELRDKANQNIRLSSNHILSVIISDIMFFPREVYVEVYKKIRQRVLACLKDIRYFRNVPNLLD